MADPFEVRMRFLDQLARLTASVNSAQKAAYYALKHRGYDEDLHSCILEQLERSNMNNRANVMFFIEQLCDMSVREGHMNFVNMVKRDILQIVDSVAPGDGTGAANVKIVRKVLHSMADKSVLEIGAVQEIDEALKERDTAGLEIDTKMADTYDGIRDSHKQLPTPKTAHVQKLSKREIEERMEEDRERHKRLKEHIWQVSGEGNAEFEKMWDEVSDIGEDDYLLAEEEAAERRAMAEMLIS